MIGCFSAGEGLWSLLVLPLKNERIQLHWLWVVRLAHLQVLDTFVGLIVLQLQDVLRLSDVKRISRFVTELKGPGSLVWNHSPTWIKFGLIKLISMNDKPPFGLMERISWLVFSLDFNPRLDLAQLWDNPFDRFHSSFMHFSPYFPGTVDLNLLAATLGDSPAGWGPLAGLWGTFHELVAAAILAFVGLTCLFCVE